MSLEVEAFLDRHLTAKRSISEVGDKLNYSPDELHELCRLSIEVFSKEPSLVKMDLHLPCIAIGDLHGAFYYLLNMMKNVSAHYSNRIVFLGNYVDHGVHSLETICLILALKAVYPSNYMVLRGNHECAEVNRKGGFYDELVGRFGVADGEKLFNHFNEIFSWMPFAGVVGRTFCVHGGLSPHLKSLEDIMKIPRPLPHPSDIPLAHDLLWSDPAYGITGFHPNVSRGRSVIFGADEVAKFCKNMGIALILRGHQVKEEGCECFVDEKFVTLFSSPRFEDNNAASVLIMDAGGVSFCKARWPTKSNPLCLPYPHTYIYAWFP